MAKLIAENKRENVLFEKEEKKAQIKGIAEPIILNTAEILERKTKPNTEVLGLCIISQMHIAIIGISERINI